MYIVTHPVDALLHVDLKIDLNVHKHLELQSRIIHNKIAIDLASTLLFFSRILNKFFVLLM